MKKIGITGNIASGKSCVENILKAQGYQVYDLDKICSELYINNENIKKQILDKFQTLDKKKIAKIVFDDKSKKKILESIIHPELKQIVLNLFKQDNEIIFVSGALIYEAGFDTLFDKIIFVDAPYNLRLKRLKKRNNLTKDDALKRINSQNDKNKSQADIIIENNDNLDTLEKKVTEALELL